MVRIVSAGHGQLRRQTIEGLHRHDGIEVGRGRHGHRELAARHVGRSGQQHSRAAPEPMIKNFEAAASGCAVFMDDVEDLDELGFIDGHTAIIYRDFSELIDKLDYWLSRPSQLERIGLAAAELCAERHTWRYRAQQFVHLIESRM